MTHKNIPKLSVLLPVYNGVEYLKQAVESVLLQSYSDFELLIIDDGSTDGSLEQLRDFEDLRIRVIHQENRGLATALNTLLYQAQGMYIARQDQDDICFSERFQQQIDFLESNPDVAVIGTAAEIWVGNVRTLRRINNPCSNSALQFTLLFDNFFVHSSVMFRRNIIHDLGGYSEEKSRQPPEDYELWSRIARHNKVGNLPDVLMAYREVPNSMSRKVKKPFLNNVMKISAENIAYACGSGVEQTEINSLVHVIHSSFEGVQTDISYLNLKRVLRQALDGVALRSGATEKEFKTAVQYWNRWFLLRYLDYRSGGILRKIYSFSIPEFIKKLIGRLF